MDRFSRVKESFLVKAASSCNLISASLVVSPAVAAPPTCFGPAGVVKTYHVSALLCQHCHDGASLIEEQCPRQ